ncbi:hypothetical protein [Mycolicibacterium brumae]|uniref:Uncharacterized protein n=1 Tax=Mycolicibacterium brumae TaxID=85968 RepID=A0A2G5P853_9MYCO|nr:hypothetical protein [Mycolicibacterium brumae]MCV7194603.1 hypothetical protein [Mycolicibacterium brumae]PIB74203.1 hypothetical protein CQY22_013975 [Mycolicibacterium brumae]RWA22960.1 hypothetical protein MBRU_11510 [Mycolicibacterium brumae DSM 44177]UWW08942.1 hypothetical protein L2Z93_002021 [Mycolicibacterium brumae]
MANSDWRTTQLMAATRCGHVEVFERFGDLPGQYHSTPLLRLFGTMLQENAKTGETRIVLAVADDHGRVRELVPGVTKKRFVAVMWDGGPMDPDSALHRRLEAWSEWGVVPDEDDWASLRPTGPR